ncbi:MAG: D-alanyl-D-alanine dipeptidase [Candidatus Doudnabacteria bacterium]|nr:D-alanyl-D-alanine dipeptidase [Candidatus Doudnabacteria bacterium]
MKFVDLQKFGFKTEPRYFFFGWSKEKSVLGRASAVKALLRAQKYLPNGLRFKVWDMQRPRYVQLNMIASFRRRLIASHPKASKAQIEKLVYKFAAKPLLDSQVIRPDCHRNGGAVDLTIIDKHGNELYMGTDHDDLTSKAATDYFEKVKRPNGVDLEARKNRRMLIKVMTKAGWENYAPEWWHWSIVE